LKSQQDVSLHWPVSSLDLVLKDPRGNLIDSAYKGANITTYPNLIYALVEQPLNGIWQLAVHGKDVPQGTTNFDALVSSRVGTIVRPSSINFGPGILVVILVLVTGGLGVYAMAHRRQQVSHRLVSNQNLRGIPSLFAVSGPLSGNKIPIMGEGISIGRSRTCELKIPDLSVSRQHARIRYAQGYWYIQDLGSTSGISVNGNRVTAAALNPGDHIQIGSSDFEFCLS
jgi:hypothetical protein